MNYPHAALIRDYTAGVARARAAYYAQPTSSLHLCPICLAERATNPDCGRCRNTLRLREVRKAAR